MEKQSAGGIIQQEHFADGERRRHYLSHLTAMKLDAATFWGNVLWGRDDRIVVPLVRRHITMF
ncbi:MAG TPA: hypothetical protein VL485_04785 [Ktedonobacteraceae bacterium]|jgi:hypothetical protein|nr:hypothetical protein [Ktedonobacteraceae bacterium]